MNVSGKVLHMSLAIIKDFRESAGDWAGQDYLYSF